MGGCWPPRGTTPPFSSGTSASHHRSSVHVISPIAGFRHGNGPNIWETSRAATSVPRTDCTRSLLLLSISIPLERVPGIPVGLVDEVAERGLDKEDAHLLEQREPVHIVDH